MDYIILYGYIFWPEYPRTNFSVPLKKRDNDNNRIKV